MKNDGLSAGKNGVRENDGGASRGRHGGSASSSPWSTAAALATLDAKAPSCFFAFETFGGGSGDGGCVSESAAGAPPSSNNHSSLGATTSSADAAGAELTPLPSDGAANVVAQQQQQNPPTGPPPSRGKVMRGVVQAPLLPPWKRTTLEEQRYVDLAPVPSERRGGSGGGFFGGRGSGDGGRRNHQQRLLLLQRQQQQQRPDGRLSKSQQQQQKHGHRHSSSAAIITPISAAVAAASKEWRDALADVRRAASTSSTPVVHHQLFLASSNFSEKEDQDDDEESPTGSPLSRSADVDTTTGGDSTAAANNRSNGPQQQRREPAIFVFRSKRRGKRGVIAVPIERQAPPSGPSKTRTMAPGSVLSSEEDPRPQQEQEAPMIPSDLHEMRDLVAEAASAGARRKKTKEEEDEAPQKQQKKDGGEDTTRMMMDAEANEESKLVTLERVDAAEKDGSSSSDAHSHSATDDMACACACGWQARVLCAIGRSDAGPDDSALRVLALRGLAPAARAAFDLFPVAPPATAEALLLLPATGSADSMSASAIDRAEQLLFWLWREAHRCHRGGRGDTRGGDHDMDDGGFAVEDWAVLLAVTRSLRLRWNAPLFPWLLRRFARDVRVAAWDGGARRRTLRHADATRLALNLRAIWTERKRDWRNERGSGGGAEEAWAAELDRLGMSEAFAALVETSELTPPAHLPDVFRRPPSGWVTYRAVFAQQESALTLLGLDLLGQLYCPRTMTPGEWVKIATHPDVVSSLKEASCAEGSGLVVLPSSSSPASQKKHGGGGGESTRATVSSRSLREVLDAANTGQFSVAEVRCFVSRAIPDIAQTFSFVCTAFAQCAAVPAAATRAAARVCVLRALRAAQLGCCGDGDDGRGAASQHHPRHNQLLTDAAVIEALVDHVRQIEELIARLSRFLTLSALVNAQTALRDGLDTLREIQSSCQEKEK